MISAFGVDHGEFSKGFRIPGRLPPGEYWHGTKQADAIKTGGFKLADPKNVSGAGRTTRSGRQITRGGAHGPGVYLTRSKREAKTYGTPLRVKLSSEAKLTPGLVNGRQVTTPQAARQGFNGVTRGKSTVVVGNPRLVQPS